MVFLFRSECGGPRPLTAARDAVLAAGVQGTAEVKARSIWIVWEAEARQQLADAYAAGWYDEELFDGPVLDVAVHDALLDLMSVDRDALAVTFDNVRTSSGLAVPHFLALCEVCKLAEHASPEAWVFAACTAHEVVRLSKVA